MAELYPDNSTLEALSNTTDSSGMPYITKGTGLDWFSSFIKMIWSILTIFKPAGELRVFKDGTMTFGVKPGKFFNGATAVTYAGATAQSLTDDATNYIYLTAAGTLTKNTTGFPAAGTTPCLPLATIATASGAFATSDVTDYRGQSLWNVSSAMTAANANTLVGAGNADALHIHSTAGLENAIADMIPKIGTITIAGEAPKTASFQLQDVQGNSLSTYGHIEAWLSDSATDRSITGTTPDGTVGWTTGTATKELTSKIHWSASTGSTGAAVLSVAHTGAAHTWYLCVSVNGLTYVSAAITLGA